MMHSREWGCWHKVEPGTNPGFIVLFTNNIKNGNI